MVNDPTAEIKTAITDAVEEIEEHVDEAEKHEELHLSDEDVDKVADKVYPVMHEKSVSHVYEDFRDAGMLAFLMKDENGNYGIAQSNVKAKKDGLAMLPF